MTQAPASDTKPSTKLLAAVSIKVRLAVISGLILGLGALLAPRAVPTGLSAPQEHVAPLLEEQVQLRETPRPFGGVQEVAARVRGHGVAIPRAQEPTVPTLSDFAPPRPRSEAVGFGVFVSDTHVLTHALALGGRSSVRLATADAGTLDAQLVAYEPSTELVLLQTAASGRPSLTLARESPVAGAFVVAVAHWDQRDIAVPVFVTSVGSDGYRLGAVDAAVLPGMPVYTLDGELVAIAAGNREGVAFPVREAATRLIARASAGEQQASFGIALQDLTGALTGAFGEQGVLVTEVIEAGPADMAGIQPGDVILAVGETNVNAADAAVRTLRSATVGTPTTARLLRGGRVRTVQVMPATAYDLAGLARASASDPPSGPEAGVLFSLLVLEEAGIAGTARVVSVNGRIVSSRAQAERELRRGRRPVPVLLWAGDKRFFAAIEPQR